MSRTRKIVATGLAASALVVAFGGAASAGSVDVTFSVANTGTLAVTEATGTVALDGGTAVDTSTASSVTGALPQVTVSDSRNPILGGWTVSVGSTSFSNGTDTIAGSKVTYWSGAATPAVGSVVVPVGQQLLELNAVTLDAQRSAVVATGATGNNTTTFTPSIRVDLSGAATGNYTGTIVHSVSGA